jgi:spermidine synthase
LSAKSFRPEIFLVSLAAILLEIGYTRIFSYKLHYYFVFLMLGIALLGLGSGGVFVAVLQRLRAVASERLLAGCCLAAALAVPLSYLVVAPVQLNAVQLADDPVEMLTLAWFGALLFLPFLMVGIVLATLFGSRPQEIDRLYFADLLGAGVGCAACVPLFASITPPGVIVLAGALLALAGARPAALAWRAGPWPALALAALLCVGVAGAERLPEPVPDAEKSDSPQRMGGYERLFSSWSTVFRVDVFAAFDPDERLYVSHDGNLGSNLIAFDGDLSKLSRFERDVRSIPFSVLPPGPEVLIVGAAGGHEILASLYFGARRVTAVELNPVTVSLLTDHFADYSGRLAEDPRVRLVNAEGRHFVEHDAGRYDLLWFVAPDSYAAMNAASSGAFVLSESYLYTQEMIGAALRRLGPGGVLCLQTGDIDFARKPNRATRYLATARAALRSLGIRDFDRHVLVASTPEFFTMVTLLLSAEPFDAEQVRRFRENIARVGPETGSSSVWHPPSPGQAAEHPVQRVVGLPEAEVPGWLESHPYDVSPITDDSPFFWHFTGFFDAVMGRGDRPEWVYDPEDGKGERVLVALLVFVTVFAALFLLLPLLAIREVFWRLPGKGHALVYFAALGLGFMFFEISLIQKLTLFLGYPTYSLTVTLFALLVFSGLGSLASRRLAGRLERALPLLLALLAGLTLFYQFGLSWAGAALGGAPLPARAAFAVLLLAPLGLALGAFLPLGVGVVATLSPHGREYVAWAWAVNGFFSVVASILATMLSMSFGFRAVLLLALAVYAIGVAALLRMPGRRAAPGA